MVVTLFVFVLVFAWKNLLTCERNTWRRYVVSEKKSEKRIKLQVGSVKPWFPLPPSPDLAPHSGRG